MLQTLCILGRQPALGRAELESLCGDNLTPIGDTAVLVDREPASIDFSRLGGSVKFAKLLTVLDTTKWPKIEAFLRQTVPAHLGYLPAGKMKLGLSIYGLDVSVNDINVSGLRLKKFIKAQGRSVRVVPNTEKFLSSAQVLHNQLTSALGWELIFVNDGAKTYIAQNIAEQDINAYAARDQRRPKRDTKVGMLPPKLAQIIINLAAGRAETNSDICEPGGRKDRVVLDPFCGTGVVLQEAVLMGYHALGADVEPRMIEYTKTNVGEWLIPLWHLGAGADWHQADATSADWGIIFGQKFDFVASEAYLGRPFAAPPDPESLSSAIHDVNIITKKFLINLHRQTQPGFRACLALPAWKIGDASSKGFKHLPVLDRLSDMGYTRVSFVHAADEDLIYHREGQIVARELVVLERN